MKKLQKINLIYSFDENDLATFINRIIDNQNEIMDNQVALLADDCYESKQDKSIDDELKNILIAVFHNATDPAEAIKQIKSLYEELHKR